MKKLVIIPAFNEADSLPNLIQSIEQYDKSLDYVIVNDGSRDQTMKLCEENGYNVINLPINSGIGVAVQTGYKYAYNNNYDLAIQIDGDGQHDIHFLEQVVEPIVRGQADVTIGSRFIEKEGFQSSMLRRFGINFLSVLIRMCTGVVIKDVTSGYRAANREYIKIFANDYSKDFPEPEAIVTVKMYGGRIKEIPVVMRQRQNGVSSINKSNSIYYMIKVTLAILIKRLSYGIHREPKTEK